MHKISERIKEARKLSGLSQMDACQLCDASHRAWVLWEQGKNEPSSAILEKLGQKVGKPLWWFYATDEELTELGHGPVPPLAPDYDPTKPSPELSKPSVRGKARKEELLRTERSPVGGIEEAAKRVRAAQAELTAALAALDEALISR